MKDVAALGSGEGTVQVPFSPRREPAAGESRVEVESVHRRRHRPRMAPIVRTLAGCLAAAVATASERRFLSLLLIEGTASMSDSAHTEPTYTFVSVSTAKPGKLQELAALASRPGERMDAALDGVIARQVGVDEERNAVIVWVTFDRKETLDDYLATADGRADHGEEEDMAAVIETFEMWNLVPCSGRLR